MEDRLSIFEAPLINLYRKAQAFWRKHGTAALIRRIHGEFARKIKRSAAPLMQQVPFIQQGSNAQSVATLSRTRFSALAPLPLHLLPPGPRRRVSVVTDSISRGSLFGGVGTTLIFATLLANRLGADLRIITRTEAPQPDNIDHVLSVYGLALDGEIQFRLLPPYEQKQSADFSDSELFVTTSWWTTAATLGSVPAHSIIYLLQEDERMFYPFGDERLRCEAILRNRDIRFLVNTRLLFDHFVAEGLTHFHKQGAWFEPAFPARVFHPRVRENGKYKFMFYARPNNVRNLFYLGIEVIEAAVVQMVIDPAQWEIVLVGKDIPEVVFGDGCVPTIRENMNWSDYAELAGTIDLGLSLMYTPHPSYPPLDLVASGAVVVTNQYGGKQDLSRYSANLICAEARRDSLVAALREGVALAMNSTVRRRNTRDNGLCTDWNDSFAEILQRLHEDS